MKFFDRRRSRRGVSEVVGALLLMLVVVIAVGSFAYFLSTTQEAAQNRNAYLTSVQNENLQIVNVELEPNNPNVLWEMRNSTGLQPIYYIRPADSTHLWLNSTLFHVARGGYGWINDSATANIDTVNHIVNFTEGGAYHFETATWANITMTIRNLNTQASGLAEISINGHVLKNWTEITPAGTVMARFGLPAQLAIPPKANVIVNANIATLEIHKNQSMSVFLVSSAGNFFHYLFAPPNPVLKLNTVTENFITTTRDIPIFDGSESSANGGSYIQSYFWTIDIPEYGWDGNWSNVANIVTILASGQSFQYFPETFFNSSQVQTLNITGPLRVTLTVVDSNGLVTLSQSAVLLKDPNISPAASLSFIKSINASGKGTLTVSVRDIFGRPMIGSPILFIRVAGDVIPSIEASITNSTGEAETSVTWTNGGILEVQSGELSPLFVNFP